MLLYARYNLFTTWLLYLQPHEIQGIFITILVFGAIIAIVTLVIISNNIQKKTRAKVLERIFKEFDDAKWAYQNSLVQLKRNPTNANLRQKTLELGRFYSYLTRDKEGITVFDEVAVMNDINAACAGATAVSNIRPQYSQPPRQTIEERLARLSELKAKGLIDNAEYNSKRLKILDEV